MGVMSVVLHLTQVGRHLGCVRHGKIGEATDMSNYPAPVLAPERVTDYR